ncbi:APC family permease [Luteirhabdus pelagi]|uniref:APC family permease n=1 Tax=Luteirhabdus pelagi TaxID=2792783 RepID=UPI0019393CA5|nr:APC family permease [Luteirhabdus pelagi]
MNKSKLTKSLGFWDVLLLGVGGVVGAGIYAIIGQATALSGPLVWISFVIAATVALLTGLTYAEFVSRFPDAGGSYEYIKQGMGPKTAILMSVFMAFTGIVAAAAIAISFAEYISKIWEIPNTIAILSIISLMGFLNIIGSKYSSYYNGFATIVTLLGLAAIIGVSIPDWGSEDILHLHSKVDLSSILAGSALIFFSYIGFEDLVKMAEETKNAKKNMPRAILLSGLIVLVLYVLIAISSVSVINWQDLAASEGPLVAVIQSKWGKIGATFLAVVALFATSKTILTNILGTSRLLYDMARDSSISWLKRLTTLSGYGNAPTVAIIVICVLAMAFGLIGNLTVVASISNIFIFLVFGMVNIALLRYRHHHKDKKKPEGIFRIPINVRNLPIPSFLTLLLLAILFGFNIFNIIQEGF